MTIITTLRFLLKKYTSGADPHPTRVEFNLMIDAIETSGAIFGQGAANARPAAGTRGRFYATTDTPRKVYYDDGANWFDVMPIGGGGAGKPVLLSGAASEGSSSFAARADHTHVIPPASSSSAGSMSVGDKQKLDAATPLDTPGTVARRDSSGRMSAASPVSGGDLTTKAYVDDQVDDLAEYVDGVALICSSITRPTHSPGRLIYETDTELRSVGGRWIPQRSGWKPYTPNWTGFTKLGAGYVSEGEWQYIGPETVRVIARLKAGGGTDMSMGSGRIFFTLPSQVAASHVIPQGSGSFLDGGPNGVRRKYTVESSGSARSGEVFAWAEQNTTLRTPGLQGYPWGTRDEMHVELTYREARA